jgi:hypothetical protein
MVFAYLLLADWRLSCGQPEKKPEPQEFGLISLKNEVFCFRYCVLKDQQNERNLMDAADVLPTKSSDQNLVLKDNARCSN